MRHYLSAFVLAAVLLSTVSCKRDPVLEPEELAADRGDVIYLWASTSDSDDSKQPNKIVYRDGLGLNGNGSAGFKMGWEVGDVLYAILWDDSKREGKGQATDQYIVLTAKHTSEGNKMLFEGIGHGLNISELTGNEHFVLVHGHFVLDPNTDGGVFDFPTSEVTKANYARHIHHGGVEETDGGLTFRNQDGTLANLKRHEYMVADAYVRFQYVTEGSEHVVKPYLSGSKVGPSEEGSKKYPDENPVGVQMRSAHTLVRLTMLLPDDMFTDEQDKRLLAVSFRESQNSTIFHRYFRLHPNTRDQQDPRKWTVDWNDQGDKESNFYFRANMPGTRAYNEINDPASPDFDQSKTACVAGSGGHFVTLYFSLPSRPLTPDNTETSATDHNLFVTVFTRTHAFRTIKSYQLPDASMKPGQIISLNVNFTGNYKQTKAVTDPNVGFTFAPGLIYATRTSNTGNWTYDVYDNQGEYAGVAQQSELLGDYFTFGSMNPRDVLYTSKGSTHAATSSATASLTTANDVAAKVKIDDVDNIFTIMTQKEATRMWKKVDQEARTQGITKGFYYYEASTTHDDAGHHTAHQAIGAWKPGGVELASNDPRRTMSSTMGIWIGLDHQPSLAEQDQYVFIPSSHQLSNVTTATKFTNLEGETYYTSEEYIKQHVTCLSQTEYNALSSTEKEKYIDIQTPHKSGESYLDHWYLKSELLDYSTFNGMKMKFSTNTRDYASPNCIRFQLWYTDGGKSNPWKDVSSMVGLAPMATTFGRVVRPVIY